MAKGIRSYLKGESDTDLPDPLYEHQEEALGATADFLHAGHLRGGIVLPTGTGKTVLFSAIARLTKARAIIVVPTLAILYQSYQEYERYLGPKDKNGLSHVSSIKNETFCLPATGDHQEVRVTTNASFVTSPEDFANKTWDLIVIDEAHNALGERFQKRLQDYGTATKIAFTATPDHVYTQKPSNIPADRIAEVDVEGELMWADAARSLDAYFPHRIITMQLKEAMEKGLLCPLRGVAVEMDVEFAKVQTHGSRFGTDFNQEELAEEYGKHWGVIVGAVIDVYKRPKHTTDLTGYEKKRAVAILPSVPHAIDLARHLNENGITAACVHAGVTNEQRQEIFEKHRSGEIQVLTSFDVLREGWNSPETEVLLMLRPTMSRLLYLQILGRVLRLDKGNPGKQALAMDFFGQYRSHAPMCLQKLFKLNGITPGMLLGGRPRNDLARGVGERQTEGPPPPIYGVSTKLTVIEDGPDAKLPRAGLDGFALIDGERHGADRAWARTLGLGSSTVTERMRKAGIRGIEGKGGNGEKTLLYSETDVRRECAELLTGVLRVGTERFIDSGKVRLATDLAWAGELGIDWRTVKRCLSDGRAKSVDGINARGKCVTLFAESDVRRLCEPYIREVPHIGSDGFVTIGKERCGADTAWGRLLGMDNKTIAKRLAKAGIDSIEGRSSNRLSIELYRESDVRRECADLLRVLPKAGKDGFVTLKGERYGTEGAWWRALGPYKVTITRRLQEAGVIGIEGKSASGQLARLYAESDVRRVCADLL